MNGRLLKVKTGYNPNSSSVGTGLPPYLFAVLGTGVVSIFVANVIDPVLRRLRSTTVPSASDQQPAAGKAEGGGR